MICSNPKCERDITDSLDQFGNQDFLLCQSCYLAGVAIDNEKEKNIPNEIAELRQDISDWEDEIRYHEIEIDGLETCIMSAESEIQELENKHKAVKIPAGQKVLFE